MSLLVLIFCCRSTDADHGTEARDEGASRYDSGMDNIYVQLLRGTQTAST